MHVPAVETTDLGTTIRGPKSPGVHVVLCLYRQLIKVHPQRRPSLVVITTRKAVSQKLIPEESFDGINTRTRGIRISTLIHAWKAYFK